MNYANISKIHQRSLWHRNQMLNQINPPPPLPLPRPPLQSLTPLPPIQTAVPAVRNLPVKRVILHLPAVRALPQVSKLFIIDHALF